MVSATVAEATPGGVNIRENGGRRITYRHADLSDSTDPHGINQDEADELVEQMGYVTGVWRWNAPGGFYKAVVASETAYRARNPIPAPRVITDADMKKSFGSAETYVKIYPRRPDMLPPESAPFFRYQVERLRNQGL